MDGWLRARTMGSAVPFRRDRGLVFDHAWKLAYVSATVEIDYLVGGCKQSSVAMRESTATLVPCQLVDLAKTECLESTSEFVVALDVKVTVQRESARWRGVAPRRAFVAA